MENMRGMAIGIIPHLGFALVFMIVTFFLLSAFLAETPDVLGTEAELITARLLNSPNGITYVDPLTGKLYPYIIDKTKFVPRDSPEYDSVVRYLEEHLYYGTTPNYAVKITYTNPDGGVFDIYLYENSYLRWKPISKIRTQGGRDINIIEKQITVLEKRDGVLEPARLNLEVVARP